jgi:hypothetical protein
MYTILVADNADDLAEQVEAYLDAADFDTVRLVGPPQADFSPPGDSAIWWQAIAAKEVVS